MLPVTPALAEIQNAHHQSTVSIRFDRLLFSSYPTSPKTEELKARYESAHATDSIRSANGDKLALVKTWR